jgi:hypothetical protein
LNDVKESNIFGLNSLEDQVIAKKVGGVGIILTRRYLLYIVMTIGAMLTIYTFILVEENNLEHRSISSITWADYKSHCGFEAYTKNPRKAFRDFELNYFG